MGQTITAQFETRRAADLAVEHLVQEYGIERTDIFVAAATDENTSGAAIGGADAAAEQPGTPARGDAPLHGQVQVSADIDDAIADKVRKALGEQGARNVAQS